jgi:hypothetical protein
MKRAWVFIFCLILFCFNSFGHEQIVHAAITANATVSAYANSSAYVSFISVISSDFSYTGPSGVTNSMVFGSVHEDDFRSDAGGNRSYNHFYDPLGPANDYGKGLSDAPFVGRVFIGKDSFTWAYTSNCLGHKFISILPYASNIGTSNICKRVSPEY